MGPRKEQDMKTYSAAEVAATTPEELARLREQGPVEDYAAWMRAAAELGLIEAQTIYGQMLLDGAGVERDQEQGLAWFKRAAHADHPMAINMVGRCYENGWGVPRDDTVAAYWFRLAADRGLDWGMYNYAHMLRSGRGGVAQDSAAALALYRKAAEAGHVKSIGVVGALLRGRRGGRAGHGKGLRLLPALRRRRRFPRHVPPGPAAVAARSEAGRRAMAGPRARNRHARVPAGGEWHAAGQRFPHAVRVGAV
jgi:hypothetical protein